jgi:pimeloyl-[acyl-carrier protein] methyl ester esterase
VNTALYCERQNVDQGVGVGADNGAGAMPLVCIHGWGMNLRAFDALRAALRPDCSSWALDLPGHGRSDWNDARADLESQLQDVQAALPPQCVLLGWSLGGQFALELARRAPQQVRALALVASTPRFPQAADWPQGLDAAAVDAFRASLDRDWRQTLRDFVQLQVRGGRNADSTQRQLEDALHTHGLPRVAALRAGLALLAGLDQRADVARIRQSVLVVSGQNDRVTPPAAGRWLADAMPTARHVLIARAGHAPLLSHVDEVAEALRTFLIGLGEPRGIGEPGGVAA